MRIASTARSASLQPTFIRGTQERDWIVLGCDMVAPTKIQALLGACARQSLERPKPNQLALVVARTLPVRASQ